jgi:HEAT repeat protein
MTRMDHAKRGNKFRNSKCENPTSRLFASYEGRTQPHCGFHVFTLILILPYSMSVHHLGLMIVFILAVVATIFVITMSLFLVIRKGIEVRGKKVRDHLSQQYSLFFANILMQEMPALYAGTRAGKRFRYYESTLIKHKKRMERMTKRSRLLHKSVIRSVLIDYSKDLKGETTERLIYYIYSLKILDELIKMMESPRWWIRAAAAKDLGLLHAKRAIVVLTAALEDSSPDVQFQAMQSLLMIGGVSSLRNILRLSKSISQWTALELSVIILEYREEAVPYFLESLSYGSPSVVLFSIAMLAQIGFTSAVEPLIQFCLSNPEPILYEASVEALGRLGDERALMLLMDASQHPLRSIRLRAVEALGRLGAKASIKTITAYLNKGDIVEKRIAAHALGNMEDDGFRALCELLNSTDVTTRLIGMEAIEEIERDQK